MSSTPAAKCVVVGDFEAEKCKLLHAELATAMGYGAVIQAKLKSNPGVFENCIVSVDTGLEHGGKIKLNLWDTSGLEDYDRLLALIYPDTDIFIVCFSLTSRTSWHSILSRWHPELRRQCPNAAILLVGTKLDLRDQEAATPSMEAKSLTVTSSIVTSSTVTSLRLTRSAATPSLKRSKRMAPSPGSPAAKRSAFLTLQKVTPSPMTSSIVTSSEGKALAEAIGAAAYVECSTSTMQGIGEVFQLAAKTVANDAQYSGCHSNADGNLRSKTRWPWLTIGGKRRAKRNCFELKLKQPPS